MNPEVTSMRIQKVKKHIQELELERDTRFTDPDTGMVTDDTNLEYVQTKQKIEKAISTLAELVAIQKQLKATEEELQQLANASEQSVVLKKMQDINLQKIIQGYMSQAPQRCIFTDDSNAIEFIDAFLEWLEPKWTTVAETQMLMLPLFEHCIKDVSRRSAFLQSIEGDVSIRSNPKKLKEAFLLFFIGNTWQGNQWTQLFSVAMGKEKPSEYVARLHALYHATGIKMDDPQEALKKPLITAWFNKLPGLLQNALKAKVTIILEGGTIQDYLTLVQEEVPQEVGYIEKCNLHCPYCPKPVTWTCECKMGKIGPHRKRAMDDGKEQQGLPKKARIEEQTRKPTEPSKSPKL